MVSPFSSLIVDLRQFGLLNSVCPRAMLRDENDYPEPESFKPERHLKNGLPDLTVRDPATIMFGFGRRWVFLLSSLASNLRYKKKLL